MTAKHWSIKISQTHYVDSGKLVGTKISSLSQTLTLLNFRVYYSPSNDLRKGMQKNSVWKVVFDHNDHQNVVNIIAIPQQTFYGL